MENASWGFGAPTRESKPIQAPGEMKGSAQDAEPLQMQSVLSKAAAAQTEASQLFGSLGASGVTDGQVI